MPIAHETNPRESPGMGVLQTYPAVYKPGDPPLHAAYSKLGDEAKSDLKDHTGPMLMCSRQTRVSLNSSAAASASTASLRNTCKERHRTLILPPLERSRNASNDKVEIGGLDAERDHFFSHPVFSTPERKTIADKKGQ